VSFGNPISVNNRLWFLTHYLLLTGLSSTQLGYLHRRKKKQLAIITFGWKQLIHISVYHTAFTDSHPPQFCCMTELFFGCYCDVLQCRCWSGFQYDDCLKEDQLGHERALHFHTFNDSNLTDTWKGNLCYNESFESIKFCYDILSVM
jgi:hypothetical protein